MTAVPKNPIFNNDDAARAHLEALRWPNGVVCVHCGATGDAISAVEKTDTRRKPTPKGKRYKPARAGRYYCKKCKGTFTVTVGTVMEDSHVPLNKWLYAFRLMLSSKKGVSAHQIHRTIGVTYKTAWFMGHRIREALRSGGLLPPMGSDGGIVEIDDTAIGRKKGVPVSHGYAHKHAVMTLIDRKTGESRTFHVADLKVKTLMPILKANIAREAQIASDEAVRYVVIGWNFVRHESVKHMHDEYVRGEWHSNTVEGFFSVFKRGMKGTYQHCSEKHLHRYLAEFDFRYSNRSKLGVEDTERTDRALKGIVGKRLTYRRPDEATQ